jgi:predicted nucleic acid-binding Zn ribbon protein
MLMVTPASLLRLRSETRSPVTLAPVRSARTKKLSKARREAIVELVAHLMRRAVPTPFRLEAPARAAIRARLCMSGWSWGQADAAADEAVQAALARVGAKRPTWKEGQPEFTQEAVLPLLREFCVRCGKPLPEENYKYCGPVCAKAAIVDRDRRRRKEEACAEEQIYRASYFKQKNAKTRRVSRRNMRMVCEAVHDESDG